MIDDLIEFYQTFSVESLSRFSAFYSDDAFFKDPFNEVRGLLAIQKIFSHMVEKLERPHFIIKERVVDADGAVLVWEFHFAVKFGRVSKPQCINGVSHLKFDGSGRVNYHRDYWDANEELFMKLPVIGVIMRRLRKVFAVSFE